MNKFEFREYLSNEPMISDLIQLLQEQYVEEVDADWLISCLERTNKAAILISPYGDVEALEGDIPEEHLQDLKDEGCTIYQLS
jgi:hypothetical protein